MNDKGGESDTTHLASSTSSSSPSSSSSSSRISESSARFVSSILELNDVFPVIFSVLATALLFYGSLEPNTTARDCWFGISVGVTLYGIAYFVGHDLVAHRRAGASFARWMKEMSPWLRECCEVHNRYHHTMSNDVDEGEDPHGPPYGFWLGPTEVKYFLAQTKEKIKRRNTAGGEGQLKKNEDKGKREQPIFENDNFGPPMPFALLWSARAMFLFTAGATVSSLLV